MTEVYFAQNGARGVIKIGVSWRAEARLSQFKGLRRRMPNFRIIGAVGAPNWGRSHEAFAHRRLALHRIVGEWFWPRPTVLTFIACCLDAGEVIGARHWFETGIRNGNGTLPPVEPLP